MHTNIEIIIGTYEAFLLGYKLEFKDNKYILVQSFADKSHTAAIKCLAIYSKWIATGGGDDRIFIYDMESRKQCQILMNHEGTVNTLEFTPEGSHLLSGADDGRIIVTSTKTWSPEAIWKKVHEGKPITRVTCHPSGKLALSLGFNLILCTWNLAKGRVAYKKNLKRRLSLERQPDCLTLSSSGQKFVICGPRTIEIWSLRTGDVEHSVRTSSKPVCVTWLKDRICLVGLENGRILWIEINNNDKSNDGGNVVEEEITVHNARVKAMSIFQNYLVTASSSGEIKLWTLPAQGQERLIEMAVTNIGCRPTSLNILQQYRQKSENQTSSNHSDTENQSESKKNSVLATAKGIVTIEYDDKNESENEEENGILNIENETIIIEDETYASDNVAKRDLSLKRKNTSKELTKEKRHKRKWNK